MKFIIFSLSLCIALQSNAQKIVYPHPVQSLTLQIEKQSVQMSYMDAQPQKWNGKTVLLLHGKNFNGYYWKDVIAFFK